MTENITPEYIEEVNELLKQRLEALLLNFDKEIKPIDEYKVHSSVSALKSESEKRCFEWRAEGIAFWFMEAYPNKNESEGHYFGPMVGYKMPDGSFRGNPSVADVSLQMMEYWRKRSNDTKHPVLRARYLGLFFDFYGNFYQGKVPFEVVKAYIESLLEVVQGLLHEENVCIQTKLSRAVDLAISYNQPDLLAKLRKATFLYQEKISDDDRRWAFVYNLLLKDNKALPTQEEEKMVVDFLENRLSSLESNKVPSQHPDPWPFETIAVPLLHYYERKQDGLNLQRVLTAYGNAFEREAQRADPLLCSALLQHILPVYRQYGRVDDVRRVLLLLNSNGPKLHKGLKKYSQGIEISEEEIKKYKDYFNETEVGISVAKISVHFTPNKEATVKQLSELAEKAPIIFHMTRQIQDGKGRAIVKVGSLEDDLDSNICVQMSQNMFIESFFLRIILEQHFKNFKWDVKELTDYLYLSPIFREEQRPIIERGVKAYLEGDFLVSMHLLIPQIETLIRNLSEDLGGIILKANESGGFDYLQLDPLLRSDEFIRTFNEDTSFYFRVVLTDRRGWNLRNDVCHGIKPYNEFNQIRADRIIHLYLRLAQLRKPEPANIPNAGA